MIRVSRPREDILEENPGGSERVVMNSLGIDVDASDSDNMKNFQKMTVDTGVFTYNELVVWFETLSKLSNCRGMAACAKEYAQRLVEEDEMDQGRYWLKEIDQKGFWLSFMKRSHYQMLMEFGVEREVHLPLIGTPVEPNLVQPVAVGASSSYGYLFPPTPPAVTGVQAALEGFAMRRPNATHAAPVGHAKVTYTPPMSTVTAGTAASEIAQAIVESMNTFNEQIKEERKSQMSLTEDEKFDKPVPNILVLEPEMGSKITVSAFLEWLKSIEEAWGKVSAQVQQVIAKLRKNLKIDEGELRKMLSEKVNQRLYISLIDKVGGTIKETVWSSHQHDGVGYIFAVLKVAVDPDERIWTQRSSAFLELPEILATEHRYLEQAFLTWIQVATEVIYSTRYKAEDVRKHLGTFLRHYPDLIATVDQMWQGSSKDYVVLAQIFVQLKKEVAEATIRMSQAKQYRWGQATARDKTDDHARRTPRGNGNSQGQWGTGRRGSSSDAEKEPKKEGSRQRSASEPDIKAAKKQGKGKGKGKGNSRQCYQYAETGTCDYGDECRFEHDVPTVKPERQGQGDRGSNSTSQNTSSGGTVRLAKADDDDQQQAEPAYEDEDPAEPSWVRMLRNEMFAQRNEMAELRGRWLELRSSCSNPNHNNNPAQPGRVVRALRTMAHNRGYTKPVGPAVDPKNTLDKPGGIPLKGGHDELGWKVVCRKPKSKKGKHQVVHGTYHAPKVLLDRPPTPNPNHPLTLKAKSIKPKQAPSFQHQLRNELAAEREIQGLEKRARKGPIVDGGSNVCITAGRERNLLENIRSAPKIKIEGIAGSVEHSGEVGDRKVGPIQIVNSIIVKDAKESVVDYETLWNNGVTGLVVTPDSQVMLFENKQLELVKDGENYRLPTSLATLKMKDIEVELAELQAKEATEARRKRRYQAHQRRGHRPRAPPGTCESCDAGAGTAGDGHKLASGFPELKEGEWSLSGDFVEVKFQSASGNTCLFNLCNQDGLGATVACKTHKASELEVVIEECLRLMRLRAQISPDQELKIRRFHTDATKSVKADVEKYWRTRGVLQTQTEGYDSNANARLERRNRSVLECARVCMLDATGLRNTYQEIWDVAMEYADEIINNQPSAGEKSPIEKSGGKNLDFDTAMEVFGCEAVVFKPKIHRNGKMDVVRKQCIWVGRSRKILGGHRVMPVIWDPEAAEWRIEALEDVKKAEVHCGVFPLRTRQAIGGSPTDFETFVDSLAVNAVPRNVYEAQEIVDHRSVEGDIEYKVHWKNYAKRDATWEPSAYLSDYGAFDLVAKYNDKLEAAGHRQPGGKPSGKRKGSVKYAGASRAAAMIMDEDLHIVMEVMAKRKLEGSIAQWLAAYKAEIAKVERLRMVEITDPKEYRRVMSEETVVRMAMRYEHTPQTSVADERCKCRWIVRGDQEPAEWFEELDSPTIMASTTKMLIASGSLTGEDDVVGVGDVDCAFLKINGYGPNDRDRFVAFKASKGSRLRIYKLTGGLYGQKDAPLLWWKTLTKFMVEELGFEVGTNDPCLYVHPKTRMRVGAHVDDLASRGRRKHTEEFWSAISAKFGVKSWGIVEQDKPLSYLSMRISKTVKNGKVWYHLDQEDHIYQFLVDQNAMGLKPVSAPMPDRKELVENPKPVTKKEHAWVRATVGSLSYYATCTRYDIAYAVNRCAQFLEKPTQGTVEAIKRIMAYLVGTITKRLTAVRNGATEWMMYSDSDHAGDRVVNGSRSVTGVMFVCNGMPIHWRSNKQPVSSTSSAVAEIYALSEAVRDMNLRLWIAEEMGIHIEWPGRIFVDNAAGVSFQHGTNPNSQLKGIFDLREQWVKELRDKRRVKAVKISTDKNVADMMTKCLTATVMNKLQMEIDILAQLSDLK